MLKEEKIKIKWSCTNKKFYTEKGYIWTGRGSEFLVSTKELNPSNNKDKIKVICDECNKEYETTMYYKTNRYKKHSKDLCNSCSKKGDRNSQFGCDKHESLKYARSKQLVNPMQGKKHSKLTREKMSKVRSEKIASGEIVAHPKNKSNKSYYKSTKMNEIFYADSDLEVFRMIQLDENKDIKSWTKRHGIKIPYKYNGITKNYIPDFLIEMEDGTIILEEVKGYTNEIDSIKKNAGEQYCKKHNIHYNYFEQSTVSKEYRKFLKEKRRNEND